MINLLTASVFSLLEIGMIITLLVITFLVFNHLRTETVLSYHAWYAKYAVSLDELYIELYPYNDFVDDVEHYEEWTHKGYGFYLND
jgi:hypothetical protein